MTISLALHTERQHANRVRCERCHAAIGETCWNTDTGETLRAPAHWQRIRTARTTERNRA